VRYTFLMEMLICLFILLYQSWNRCDLSHIAISFFLWDYRLALVRLSLPLNFSPGLMPCRYERIAWIPVIITFIITLGVGGKNLSNPPPATPATAATVLGFASTLAGFAVTYSGLSSDFTSYFRPDISRLVDNGLNPSASFAYSFIQQKTVFVIIPWILVTDRTSYCILKSRVSESSL